MTLNVYGERVKIRTVKNLIEKTGGSPAHGDGAVGYYDPSSRTIGLDHRLKGDAKMSTIIHEVFHAYCSRIGIRQMPSWSIDTEERIAEEFATVLIENFRMTLRK